MATVEAASQNNELHTRPSPRTGAHSVFDMNALTAHLSQTALPRPAVRPAPHPPAQRPAEVVQAAVNYTHPPPQGEQLFQYVYQVPDGRQTGNLAVDERTVQINNIHTAQRQFSLLRNGFQLEPLTVDSDIDWSKDDQVHQRYYPAIEQLIKQVSGASRVHVFDHTLRSGSVRSKQLGDPSSRTPVSRVHVDYNATSGVQRLHAVMPNEAEELSKTPFAVIQVWKPLRGPVEESPLAMIDASTVAKEDLMDLRLEFESRTGYNYALKYNPAHQWYYAADMRADEAYVFSCYNSRNDRARFTPHTAFFHPATRPDAPPRESIEIRAYAFWENDEPQPAVGL